MKRYRCRYRTGADRFGWQFSALTILGTSVADAAVRIEAHDIARDRSFVLLSVELINP